MAKRNYTAEYERRNALARSRGYSSYWAERQHLKVADQNWPGLRDRSREDDYSPDSRAAFLRFMREGKTPERRKLYAQGVQAERDHDQAQARRIARQLGWRRNPAGRAQGRQYAPSVFWYH